MTESPKDRKLVEMFVSKALRSDGVLLMRFISGHTGDMLVTELMFRYVSAAGIFGSLIAILFIIQTISRIYHKTEIAKKRKG